MKKNISFIIVFTLFTTVCFGDVSTRDNLKRVEDDLRLTIENLISGEQNINKAEILKQLRFDATILEGVINTTLRDYKTSTKSSDRSIQLGYLNVATGYLTALASLQEYLEEGKPEVLIRAISEYSFAKSTFSQIK